MTQENFEKVEIFCDCNVDTIVHFNNIILAGSYDYKEDTKTRSGSILCIDPSTDTIVRKIPTSGTFELSTQGRFLISANASDVTVYDVSYQIIFQHKTSSFNSSLYSGSDFFLVGTIDGEILYFKRKEGAFELLYTFKQTYQPIWAILEHNNNIFYGTEEGYVKYFKIFKPDYQTILGSKRQGIIDLKLFKNQLHVCSYDDNLEIFDMDKILTTKNSLKPALHSKTSSLWNLQGAGYNFYAASMYDGLKIFDSKFTLISQLKTNSICYGICLTNEYVYYSSFYDSVIFKIKI